MSHADHAGAPRARPRIVNPTSDQVRFLPRALIRAIGGLVVAVTALVALMRVMGVEPAALPPVQAEAASALLVLAKTEGSGMRVTDARTGALVADLSFEQAGFISGVHRALGRVRMQHGAAFDAPVRVVRWEDGRLSLIDPATNWRVELLGFGTDNEGAFARLLD